MSGRGRWSVGPGCSHPLGANLAHEAGSPGVNFAVVSEAGERVELCLFDDAGHEQRLTLPSVEHGVHSGFVAGVEPGQRYGYRVYGPHAPARGLRFNPHKLLLDPYAREVVGNFEHIDLHYGHQRSVRGAGEWALDTRDNAALALQARVAAPLPRRRPAPPPPCIPMAETLLYELHVKGFSMLRTQLPPALRGTYAGLAHPTSVAYLRELGVTTLSLLPVHYSLSEQHLEPLGLRNYWGYNTIAYFCPDPRLSSTPDDPSATRAEFRAMVDALHAAGLEVVLDVVYNHTAEAGDDGPTLSFRGLDNQLYYRLQPTPPRACLNWSGCGNTLDTYHPRVTQLVLDSLRFWVGEMGVDGFRFDLAPALGRRQVDFDARAPLLVAMQQDPVLSRAKLIAEPWDLGPAGYQAGHFPGRFCEWNDHYRDEVRRAWLRRDVDRGVFARRLAGSNDRFHHGQRRPSASVNFISAHDGFTLADALAHTQRHNLQNGEHNRDGHAHEVSSNCGVEGETQLAEVLELRARLRRSLLTTLLMSIGTPMLLAGDEIANGQRGNNNAYCQDNELGWIEWGQGDLEQLAFVRELIALRRELPVFRADRWLSDHAEADAPTVEWLRPDGAAMDVADWHDAHELALAMVLGHAQRRVVLLFNPNQSGARFQLPPGRFMLRLDSARPKLVVGTVRDESIEVAAHAVLVLSSDDRP